MNVDHLNSGYTSDTLKWTIRQTQKQIALLNQKEALNAMAIQMYGNESRNPDFASPED